MAGGQRCPPAFATTERKTESMGSKKDKIAESMPAYINIPVESLGRQVHVRKATLGEKLKLMTIFSLWMAELGKGGHISAVDKKELTKEAQNEKRGLAIITQHLPVVMGYLAEDYAVVLGLSTDLKADDMEKVTNLGELVEIFKAIWDINKFEDDVEHLGKALGDLGLGGFALAPKKKKG